MPRSKNILWAVALVLVAGALIAAPDRKAARARASERVHAPARHRQRVVSARPLVVCYYVEDSRGLRSIEENADHITLLSPQSFALDADGIVNGSIPLPVAALAERKQLPLMPLVVNPEFDRETGSKVLRSPALQERAASYLAYLARRGNLVGWQLDLENLDPADKPHYSAFVRRVAAKLHRDGRLLSVAVTPRFSDSFPDDRDVDFRTGKWGAPFDYRALAASADFIVVMAYDQHTSATPPGPVAGYDWVRAAIVYAATRVPPHKLVLGVPLYGREWVETPFGRISRSMNYETLGPLLERPDIEKQWHEAWRTPWVQYRDEPDTHTVWFDNRRSLEEKLNLAREFGLRGIAAWRVGIEGPDFWSSISEWAAAESSRAAGEPHQTRGQHRRSSRSSK